MHIRNQTEMKDHNIRRILRSLLLEGPISRADLCRQTGLTPSAVSALTRELLENGIIEEIGPQNRPNQGAGRPPCLLSLVPHAFAALGVEIGVDHLAMGVVDLSGEFLRSTQEVLPGPDPDTVLNRIIEFAATEQEHLNKSKTRLTGIGVAVTGLVDSELGINRFAPNLGWRDVPVKRRLEEKLSLPVVINNNVRLMALGEEWYGTSKNSGSLIFVQVGQGVGCGIVLPHIGLWPGSFNGAGELGHCTVLPGGPRCRCGKQGCLEALVSEQAIVSSYLQRVTAKPSSGVNPASVNIDTIVEAANNRDVEAISVLQEAANYLGIGLATLINIFEPRQIVLNGNSFALSPLTRRWITESLQQHCFCDASRISITDATYRDLQGVIGAATAAFQKEVL